MSPTGSEAVFLNAIVLLLPRTDAMMFLLNRTDFTALSQSTGINCLYEYFLLVVYH